MSVNTDRVVLAMSGGVDSCAAAILLCQQGYDVIGVSMQVWDYRTHGGNAGRATCCAPSDFDDARKISEKYKFPFYVFDFEESFKENVINPFVDTYLKGETPNPCLDCNRKVKFYELRKRSRALGASAVATGHYARIREKEDGSLGLFTSRDLDKDQSYFLYALTQAELRETLFPVGDMIKSDVRKILSNSGFSLSQKPESQDICFVANNVSDFIKSKGQEVKKGSLKKIDGSVVGQHEGIYNYTIGQRRGLGISHHSPLYVINIDASDNSVTVGEKDALEREDFYVKNVSWVANSKPQFPFKANVKLRYRHAGVKCLLNETEVDGTLKLNFLEDWSPISPGQAAVFYQIDEFADPVNVGFELLGGGIIAK